MKTIEEYRDLKENCKHEMEDCFMAGVLYSFGFLSETHEKAAYFLLNEAIHNFDEKGNPLILVEAKTFTDNYVDMKISELLDKK